MPRLTMWWMSHSPIPKADHAMQEPPAHEDPRAVDNQSVGSDGSWDRVECAPEGDNPPIDPGSFHVLPRTWSLFSWES